MKPEYKPDYISKPSYSGLRPGLKPTYLTDRRKKELKSMEKKQFVKMATKSVQKPVKNDNKMFNLVIKPQLMENSKIFVKQLDSHNGSVVRTYQVQKFDQIAR